MMGKVFLASGRVMMVVHLFFRFTFSPSPSMHFMSDERSRSPLNAFQNAI
jgi:hypothetical protein